MWESVEKEREKIKHIHQHERMTTRMALPVMNENAMNEERAGVETLN
jgi:hypothetical protein